MDIKVSVIVPVYNVELYLRECLDSLVEQTLKEIEIITVNDGSTDSSPLILREYQERYENVQIIDKINGGLSSARNAGVEASKGKYIYYLDSDDYIDKNALEILYNAAEENRADLVLCNGKAFFDDEYKRQDLAKLNYVKKADYPDIYSGKELFCKLEANHDYRTQVSMQFVKREILITHNLRFLHGIIHEDLAYLFELLFFCEQVKVIKDILFYRRFRDGSIMTSAVTTKNFIGFSATYQEMLKFMKANEIPSKYKGAYMRHLGETFGAAIIHHYYNLNRAERKESKEEFQRIISLTKAEKWITDKKIKFICNWYPLYGVYKSLRSVLER